MAKADEKTTPAKTAATAEEPSVETATTAERALGECVVDDGTPHVGRAVNGVVCSYHAMHYDPRGNRRGEVAKGQ